MCGWIMNALHAVGVDNLHPYDLLSRIAYLASRLSPLIAKRTLKRPVEVIVQVESLVLIGLIE